jgi:RNA polymerase sigma factor (TIGR02999 family)
MDGVVRKIGPDLHRLARHYLKRERRNHTLDSRALVHEAYVRLAGQDRVSWRNRQHFLGVAAQTMRRILCDYARKRKSVKRGGRLDRRPISLSEIDANLVKQEGLDMDIPIGIDLALERLSLRDPVAAELVELRYFGGFTLAEISEILDIPARTLSRRWRFARAWLYKELNT